MIIPFFKEIYNRPNLQVPFLALIPVVYGAGAIFMKLCHIPQFIQPLYQVDQRAFWTHAAVIAVLCLCIDVYMLKRSARESEIFSMAWIKHILILIIAIPIVSVFFGMFIMVFPGYFMEYDNITDRLFPISFLIWYVILNLFYSHIWEKAPISAKEALRSRYSEYSFKQQWENTDHVPRHDGHSVLPRVIFFKSPPQSIGKVVSADSSLMDWDVPIEKRFRITYMFMVMALVFFIGKYTAFLTACQEIWQNTWIITVVIVGAAVAYRASRFYHTCSFVGVNGFAVYACNGSAKLATCKQEFEFSEANDFIRQMTHVHRGGNYLESKYCFLWYKHLHKRPVLSFKGSFNKDNPNPQLHFVNAVESQWTVYKQEQLAEELAKYGEIEFKMESNRGTLRLKKRELVLRWKKDEVAFPLKQMRTAVDRGMFFIIMPDPAKKDKPYTFKIRTETIANFNNLELFLKRGR